MTKYYKVIDNQEQTKQNYFSIVFFRCDKVKRRVSRIRWAWFCFIEVLFGEEILESLVTTASVSGCPEDIDTKGEYGLPQQLNMHIPSGVFTNLFRSQIVQVLYYKYYLQYLFINPVANIDLNHDTFTIAVTRIRFRLKKDLLYLVIAFRRVYLLSALVLNICIDLLIYLISNSLEAAVISAIIIESIRRVLKI